MLFPFSGRVFLRFRDLHAIAFGSVVVTRPTSIQNSASIDCHSRYVILEPSCGTPQRPVVILDLIKLAELNRLCFRHAERRPAYFVIEESSRTVSVLTAISACLIVGQHKGWRCNALPKAKALVDKPVDYCL